MSAHFAHGSFQVLIRNVSFGFAVAALFCTLGSAGAQTVPTETPLDRQLSRLDLGISGAGEFTRQVSGTVIPSTSTNAGQPLSDETSSTVGALVTLRYIAKPFVGLEGNYTYARYTENYSYQPFGVQTQANEFTLGYIATPAHSFFGFQPFASAGLGSIEFKPTRGGGQELSPQARAAYYYSLGVQQEYFSSHFGLRASFRQVFFLAPDFGQNYLTIKQHTITSEPTVGFYLRF